MTVIFLGLISLFYLIFDYLWVINNLINIKKWIYLECNIKEYELEKSRFFNDIYDNYKVIRNLRNIRVIYQYSYDDVPYSGGCISPDDYLLTSGNYSEERIKLITSGLLDKCYVNPSNPEESVLFSEINKVSLRYIAILSMVLFTIILLGIHNLFMSNSDLFPVTIFKIFGYSFIASSIIWGVFKRYTRGVVNASKDICSDNKSIHEKTKALKWGETYGEFKVGLGFLLAPIVLASIHFLVCFLAYF